VEASRVVMSSRPCCKNCTGGSRAPRLTIAYKVVPTHRSRWGRGDANQTTKHSSFVCQQDNGAHLRTKRRHSRPSKYGRGLCRGLQQTGPETTGTKEQTTTCSELSKLRGPASDTTCRTSKLSNQNDCTHGATKTRFV
jgi:hypothetical protein